MSPWSESDIAYLREQRALGTAISAIALHLNRNRGAVAGKSKRLNIPTPNPPCLRAPKPKHLPPEHFVPADTYNPESRNLLLEDLAHDQCRWPYGDGHPRFFFCGADTDLYPYCNFHRKLAYRKPW